MKTYDSINQKANRDLVCKFILINQKVKQSNLRLSQRRKCNVINFRTCFRSVLRISLNIFLLSNIKILREGAGAPLALP